MKPAPGTIRIVGGHWRGTKLPVPDSPGLRPSSDRVRETLFNWLMPKLPGARVLDLFAGTGVLGLEAVSRGAASATLVERDPRLVANLRQAQSKLSAQAQVEVVQADALAWLPQQPVAHFDIAFLDPPFAGDLWDQAIAALLPRLADNAWLYVESPADRVPRLPQNCVLHREGSTRDVRYALYRCEATATLRPETT